MKTSAAGVRLIQQFEGLRLRAYQDAVGVWTIGWGSTRYRNGDKVRPGDTITEPEAEALLRATLETYEQGVLAAVTAPLSQAQFDACVSLAYNVGVSAFANSTLVKHLNAGRVAEAADEFRRWNRAGGRVLAGLTRRREVERALFLNGDSIATTPPAEPAPRKEPPMLKDFILARLGEASSWRGIFAMLTALGVTLSPEQQNAILAIGLAVIGAIGVFVPDRKA